MATVAVTTAQVTGLGVRVTVTVTSPVAGSTMTLYRVEGSREVPVLGAIDVPAASTVFDDVEVGLNTPATWRAVLSTGEVGTSAPRTVSNALCVLSEPYSGRWVEVAILDLGERESAQRGKALDIEETAEVVYVYDVESAERHPISLLTFTDEDQRALLDLAASGAPLLLRSACPVHAVGWFARDGGSRRTSRLNKYRASDPRMVHTFSSTVRVPIPAPDVRPAGDTLGDLHAVVPTTLGAISTTWATLGAIAAADLRSL